MAEHIEPCKCGRLPRLEYRYSTGWSDDTRVVFQVACRRFFGLKTCALGPEQVNFWGDLGARRAVERWNEGERV